MINLVNVGFVRSQADDFTDDGSRFVCYKVGKMRVSKCMSCGEAYISAHMGEGEYLPYDVYSKLPHYNELDALNGVEAYRITKEDLINLYNACIAYEREYEEALAQVKTNLPTRDQLKAKQKEINDAYDSYVKEARDLILTDKFLSLDESTQRSVLSYFKSMQRYHVKDSEVESYVGRVQSLDFMKRTASKGYYSEYILKALA